MGICQRLRIGNVGQCRTSAIGTVTVREHAAELLKYEKVVYIR